MSKFKLHQLNLLNQGKNKMTAQEFQKHSKTIQQFNQEVSKSDKKFQPKKWKKR